MYSCHNTAVFIRVARAARGLQVPTLRRPQDGRKWSAGKSKDMSAHQREEAHNGGCTPESVLNYLEIWLRRPPRIYVAFSRGLGVKKTTRAQTRDSDAKKCDAISRG
jgi:hypothetical protein